MVDLVKQSMTYIWATSGDIVAPDVAKIESGWAVETVPRQWWNWMQNRVDNNVAYLLQKGISEWDIATEYIINKSYVQHQNVVYKCIQTNTNQEPSLSPTYWVKAFADSTVSTEALSTVTPAADVMPYFTGTSTAATTPITAFARTLLDDIDATAARATLSAQAFNIALTALSGVTPAANQLPYFTGTNTAAITGFTAFARTLLDDADAATARTTLGLGSMSTQNSSSVTITGGTISGITDLAIADGGTGASDAAGARTNLGLGTAATATLTTSNQDSTAGRVVKVGDFGFGSSALTTANFNSITITGTYQGTDAIGAPSAGVLWIVQHFSASTTQAFQVASRAGDDIRYRTESGGVWSAWVAVQHSGNQLSLGTTAASARAALGLANSATIAATTAATPNTIVQRDASGLLVDSVASANKLATARTIALSGGVTGSASFDGSANATIAASLLDSGWLSPTLVNSFTHHANALQYRKVGNIVYVQGTVERSAVPTVGITITTIPAGYRPNKSMTNTALWVDAGDFSCLLCSVGVNTSGALAIGFLYGLSGSPSGAGAITFDISYPVA